MNTIQRLAAFAAVGAAVLGIGAGLGTRFAVGGDDAEAGDVEPLAAEGAGVVVATDGYRLVLDDRELPAGGGELSFSIIGPDGVPVRAFDTVHERDLHLIVASRDLTTYHHLHPELDAAGTWSIAVPALPAGPYRAITDFQVADGPHLVLGADVDVAGPYEPSELMDPQPVATVDGYEVTMSADLGGRRDGSVELTMTVHREGRIGDDLQPYLGAMGHLVALRSGDLAYAHVHPHESTAEPGVVRFDAVLDAAGRYALFFDFQVDGVVRTATFTFDQGLVTAAPSMEH
ncbi:MAG: hypothetical protein HZB15_08685 [Actinobacteria bacterium]|nr:hypothetical protein [Actinomycetota bacterium]